MSETIPDIVVTGTEYLDINTASGIAVGTEFIVVNKSTQHMFVIEKDVQPDNSSTDGLPLTTLINNYGVVTVHEGSLRSWVRCSTKGVTGKISVQIKG